MQVVEYHGRVSALHTSLFKCFLGSESHHIFGVGAGLVAVEICRDTMSPPELTADAPVLNIFKPDAVCGLILFGDEADNVVEYGLQALVGEVLHLHEPLERETRLHGHLCALR